MGADACTIPNDMILEIAASANPVDVKNILTAFSKSANGDLMKGLEDSYNKAVDKRLD